MYGSQILLLDGKFDGSQKLQLTNYTRCTIYTLFAIAWRPTMDRLFYTIESSRRALASRRTAVAIFNMENKFTLYHKWAWALLHACIS